MVYYIILYLGLVGETQPIDPFITYAECEVHASSVRRYLEVSEHRIVCELGAAP